MLTKSTGIKNICRGKLGFLKFSAFYKGKHTLDQSDWAAVYKEKTVPRRMFLISMDSYHKILLVLGTIVRLEGCCRPLSSESQDTVSWSGWMNLEKLVEDLTVKMLKTIFLNVLDNITICKEDSVKQIKDTFNSYMHVKNVLNSRVYFCHNILVISNFYNNMSVSGGFYKCITPL